MQPFSRPEDGYGWMAVGGCGWSGDGCGCQVTPSRDDDSAEAFQRFRRGVTRALAVGKVTTATTKRWVTKGWEKP